MGVDKIRHLRAKKRQDGTPRFYWEPSATLLAMGLEAEALGTNAGAARARAIDLNNLGDELRNCAKTGSNGPKPGSVAKLFADYRASEEFGELKPRTRSDYAYYLDKIEAEFGHVMVRAITPKVIKTHYRRVRKEKGVTWSYHILGNGWRPTLSWAVSEDWIASNPALEVMMKAPKKRDVIWEPKQAATYIAKAMEMGWKSIVAMAHVFDSIGQSPIDVRTLLRKSYDGRRISVSREKTGVKGAPIILFPVAVVALDDYLAAQARHPEAPLFLHERTGRMWHESTLQHTHAKIRTAAGLPKRLQLQDFRTTVQTEGGAAGGTVDELKGLGRHLSRAAGEHYVHPDGRFVDSIQEKRLAHRKRAGANVGTTE